MGKARIKVDYKQFQHLAKQFEQIAEKDIHEFNVKVIKELAARLLAKIKERTPVFDPPNFDNVTKGGGRTRDSWTIGNVTKSGNTYSAEIVNPLLHASYLEKGYRGVAIYITSSGGDIGWRVMHLDTHWTEGKFMMKNSEDELAKEIDKIVENKLKKFISEML